MKTKDNETISLEVLSILGIIFITLKLCNVITWSWWLVLLPFYAGLAILAVILLIAFICVISIVLHKKEKDSEKKQ